MIVIVFGHASFARAVEAKCDYTRGHSERVCRYALALAEQVGIADDEMEVLRRGALLHDLGKMSLPDAILNYLLLLGWSLDDKTEDFTREEMIRLFSLERVVKATVFLVDLGEFAAMNEVYARHVGGAPPARSTVEIAALPSGAKVEIDAIAEL